MHARTRWTRTSLVRWSPLEPRPRSAQGPARDPARDQFAWPSLIEIVQLELALLPRKQT